LLLAVSTAGGSDSLRVQVWRRLRSLGGVYLQQSVCLLPARPELRREAGRLIAKVAAGGGTSRCLSITVDDPGELHRLVGEFNAARDGEYQELTAQAPSLPEEISREIARGRATYVEVEECEAALERFERWLASIQGRDYFDAPCGAAARAAVQAGRVALAEFQAAALRADTSDPERK
jgi:hypothetical protein